MSTVIFLIRAEEESQLMKELWRTLELAKSNYLIQIKKSKKNKMIQPVQLIENTEQSSDGSNLESEKREPQPKKNKRRTKKHTQKMKKVIWRKKEKSRTASLKTFIITEPNTPTLDSP